LVRALLVLSVVLLMMGCSGSGGGGSSGGPGAAGSGEGSPGSSLQLASPSRQPVGGAEGTYIGVLGADPIEGGCTYLQTADGQRYEIIPPDGWQLRKGAAEFVAPDGSVVARAGDRVTIRGHEADMVSICQIGPIVQAVEITPSG
jgi:hypothetical protein